MLRSGPARRIKSFEIALFWCAAIQIKFILIYTRYVVNGATAV